jgi:hypothetical protein
MQLPLANYPAGRPDNSFPNNHHYFNNKLVFRPVFPCFSAGKVYNYIRFCCCYCECNIKRKEKNGERAIP